MRRHLSSLLAALSLTCCLATAELWARSRVRQDHVRLQAGDRGAWGFSTGGSVQVMLLRFHRRIADRPEVDWSLSAHDPDEAAWLLPLWPHGRGILGLRFFRQAGTSGLAWKCPHTVVTVPLWLVAALLAVLPAERLVRWVRGQRRSRIYISA